MISSSSKVLYPDVRQKRLLKFASKHFPIFLECRGLVSGREYFKFENMCLKEKAFVEKVRRWWASYNFIGSPSFVLAKKLKTL